MPVDRKLVRWDFAAALFMMFPSRPEGNVTRSDLLSSSLAFRGLFGGLVLEVLAVG